MRMFLVTLMMWAVAGAPRMSVAAEVNACGCYRGDDGNCICTKTRKPKCACPGDCEPMGCEAQRQKEADREAEAALKRIEAKEKRKAEEAKKEKKSKKK